jgi:hypothetical protein
LGSGQSISQLPTADCRLPVLHWSFLLHVGLRRTGID